MSPERAREPASERPWDEWNERESERNGLIVTDESHDDYRSTAADAAADGASRTDAVCAMDAATEKMGWLYCAEPACCLPLIGSAAACNAHH